jgi:hypothetical protein
MTKHMLALSALLLAWQVMGACQTLAQTNAAAIFGRILVIDPVVFQNAGRAATDGMLDDIERFEKAAPEAKLAVIYADGSDLEILDISPRDRLQLRSVLANKLKLYAPPRYSQSTIMLNRVREQVRLIGNRWHLSNTGGFGAPKRVVVLKVFALRWHFDLERPFGQLYEYQYSNDCAVEYQETTRPWPGSTILEVEFRPPIGEPEPPESAMMGFVVSLSGVASNPPYIRFRGAAGPYCDEGSVRQLPYIPQKDPDAPICEPGSDLAVPGAIVTSCSRAKRFDAIAANLVRRPVSLVARDGEPGAQTVSLRVDTPQSHQTTVRAGAAMLASGGVSNSLGSSGIVPLTAVIQPRPGCRGDHAVSFQAQLYGHRQPNVLREQLTAVASSVPCVEIELPLGEVQVR